MGPQPDTSTSAPEVWHGVLRILAPIFVARLLATYLVWKQLQQGSVIGAKPRARRCSMRSRSERGARNSAIFWRQTTGRHGMIPNLPGVLPLLNDNEIGAK